MVPQTLLEGMSITPATLETNMEVPQKLKIELSYDPNTFGYIPKCIKVSLL
jgi:hypothetical protein